MAFFKRAFSGHMEKSMRSKRRIEEIRAALDELQCNLDKISQLVKENHEIKVAVESVFDSSLLSAQVFLKSPTRQSLFLNKDEIFNLFSTLSDQDMPVAALIFDLLKQYGLDAVSDIVLKYLDLISPLLHCKRLDEERCNPFAAIEDAWQIGNLFQDGNSSKMCKSEPNSPKLMQFVSNFLRKRNAIQQEPLNFQESDINNPASAVKPADNSCCDRDVELSENRLQSSKQTFLNEVVFLFPKDFDKDAKIKTVARQEKPETEAKESDCSIRSSESQPKVVIDASANEGKNENFAGIGDDKAQVTAVCVSVPSPYKLSDMEVDSSARKANTSANFLKRSVFLMKDGAGRKTADRNATSKTPYKLSDEGNSTFEHSDLNTPISAKMPASFPRHSRHRSYAEGDNRTKRRDRTTGHSFNCADSENFDQSARFRRIGYTGSEGQSFSIYTTDSEDESLSVSTDVSLLVAASESQQLDVDPQELSDRWTASIDYSDIIPTRGEDLSDSDLSFGAKQQSDKSGSEGRDREACNEGAGGCRRSFLCDEKEDLGVKIIHSMDQFNAADVQCVSDSTSCGSCTTYGKLVIFKDPERADLNSSSKFCSCMQPCSAKMESLQHDAEMAKERHVDRRADGINHLIDSMQRESAPLVLTSTPPDYFGDELSAEKNKSIAFSDVAESDIKSDEGKSTSFKMVNECRGWRGIAQDGESIMPHHVGKLHPDSADVRFSIRVAKNATPVNGADVAAGSFFDIAKIPLEICHRQGITSGGLSLSDSDVTEVEGSIPAYNTSEESQPLDKFEVPGEKKSTILDQTAEINRIHIYADQKGDVAESLFVEYGEDHYAGSMDLPADEDQKHIIEHSKAFVHGKAEHEKVLETDVRNQEYLNFFAGIEQLEFATDLIATGNAHLHPVKNSNLDIRKSEVENKILSDFKSKLQHVLQDPVNTCSNLADCKMATVSLDQLCADIVVPKLRSSMRPSDRTDDDPIESIEFQKHIQTITSPQGNIPIDHTTKNNAAKTEDRDASSIALAAGKPQLHIMPRLSTDAKVSDSTPGAINSMNISDKHLTKCPIFDQAFIYPSPDNISDAPLSATTVYSYTSLLSFLRSYAQRKLFRPTNPLYCHSWNSSSSAATTRIKLKTKIDKLKTKWPAYCACCNRQAEHLED